MEVLLFHGNRPFTLNLKMKYLKEKSVPYWVYHYEEAADRFRKIQPSEMKSIRLNEWDTFVSTSDLGDVVHDVYGSPESHEGCFSPLKEEFRYNKDMIAIIKREKDLFYNIEVVAIRKGERFRILYDYDCFIEIIELEKDIIWVEATD